MNNYIIAQNGAVVNIYAENVTQKPPKNRPKPPKTARKSSDIRTAEKLAAARAKRAERQADACKPMWQRWDEHKALAVMVGERLIQAGLPKRGWRVKMCNNELDIVRCADCGHITIRGASLCRDRLCPLCAWRLAIKRYAAMQKIMAVVAQRARPNWAYFLITLTAKNCAPSDLSDTIKSMSAAWTACTYQRWWRKWIIGWARSVEVTYNDTDKTLHPHYHILLISDGGTDTAKEVIGEWIDRARREGLTVSAAAQHYDTVYKPTDAGESFAGAVCEVYKYMVKSSDTLAMPLGILHDFAVGIAGARLVSMGGAIKDIARQLSVGALDDATEDAPDEELCTHCGSRAIDKMVATWAMSGMHYYTAQGKTLSDLIEHPPAED